jgi:hypothetical protein
LACSMTVMASVVIAGSISMSLPIGIRCRDPHVAQGVFEVLP